MVYLVFIHKCGTGCPFAHVQVLVQQQTYDNGAFPMPDVRCVATGDKLYLFSMNGMMQ